MPDEFAKRPEFGQLLEAEVGRILADPTLQRSPVLSRLLRFLRDQTIKAPNTPITQVSIAVDGLGRREDYDQDAESYVRVQISRLRRALGEYYARNQPGSGFCVFLRHGDYAIRLASPDRAYPDQHGPTAARETPGDHDYTVPRAKLSISRAPVGTIFAVAAAIVGIWFAITQIPGWLQGEPAIAEPPRVFVSFGDQDTIKAGSPFSERPKITEMEIRKVLTSSAVARGSDPDSADYRLAIYFADGGAKGPEVFLRLTDANSFVHFTESIPIAEDQEKFVNALDARLAAIFSSSGVIAKDLVKRFEHRKPKSGFECFLATEAERAGGQLIEKSLKQCLADFPGSPYAAYWHARIANGEYRAAISRGEPVRRNSGGWNSLVSALKLDRFNPIANSIATKIELVEGDCNQALLYMSRAQARSLADPALNAALLVDALPCFSDPEIQADRREALEDLIAANPDADPGLRLQLVLGALELGKAAVARELLHEAIGDPASNGDVARTLRLLDRHFGEMPGGKPSPAELRDAIRRFVWNPAAQQAIFQTLANL